ncbi:MAG: JAB domain-containing protein [Balneola sp.]|tara:strand:+ start:19884 stop:20327 length:444 start_codon:yes stop_codon:yes gene_type:complete
MPQIAEVSLAYRSIQPVDSLPTITSPQEAATYLRSIWNDDHLELKEEFIVILLNNKKHVLGWNLVSTGGATATIVEISSIFQVAMLGNSQSIVLAHNHPSSNPNPSNADIQITKRAVEAGKILGITVDDHIIIYRSGYTSLRNEGYM